MKNAKLLIKSENIDIKKSLYKQALSINDYYTACLYFNELKYMNDPEIFYLQAQLYSKFPSLICCEIDCIIKMLTYEKFEYFNFMYVYDTIMTYAASVNAIDIAKHYVFLLSDRLTGKIKIKLVSEKKNILKTTNFKILDNISQSNLLDEAAMYFVKRNYDKAENILSVVDEDSRESHKSKILQCYLLLAKMKYNDAEILALQILKQYPNDSEVVPILYQLTEKLTDKQKELYNIIIDISNKVSNPIVYMIAGSVYCKLQQFNKALKYVDSDIIKFEDQYKVYYLYMKARCEYNLGNISKAVEYLKYEHCLFPKDFYARHILKKIEGNSTVDDKLFDRSSIIAESHIVFDEIVKLMSESNGEKLTYLDNNDLSFYLHWLNFLNIQQLTNEFINKLICSNYNNKVLLDFLIMTEISESFKKCIIIQLVEKLYM